MGCHLWGRTELDMTEAFSGSVYLCILARKKKKYIYRKGKLESNEIGYLGGWLGPELKEWEDENGSEE